MDKKEEGKEFTKKELEAYIEYDIDNRTATISSSFLSNEGICVDRLRDCVQSFLKNRLTRNNFQYNPYWPVHVLQIINADNQTFFIEYQWLNEMIEMYKDAPEMLLNVSYMVSLCILCDGYALAKNDTDSITLDIIPIDKIKDLLDVHVNNILN